jgi:RNA polymerase sigma-70 factor (ECF subfamily)
VTSDVDDIIIPKDLAAFVHGFARDATPGDDSQRFGRLVLPHLKQAYALARWIIGDRIGAANVVQEACVHVLRTTAAASDCNVRAVVLAAVRNAAAAWLRK